MLWNKQEMKQKKSMDHFKATDYYKSQLNQSFTHKSFETLSIEFYRFTFMPLFLAMALITAA